MDPDYKKIEELDDQHFIAHFYNHREVTKYNCKMNFIHYHQLQECEWDVSDSFGEETQWYKNASNNYFYFNVKTQLFTQLEENDWLMQFTPEGKEKHNKKIQELKQQFLIQKGLTFYQVSNKAYYWNKETNELYQEIEYTYDVKEQLPERYFKQLKGNKFLIFLKEYKEQS